jgi:hypothetical protein
MKNYIFDREKDDFIKDEDGQRIVFKSSDQVYKYLKGQEFTDDFINKNFYIMKSCKIIGLEDSIGLIVEGDMNTHPKTEQSQSSTPLQPSPERKMVAGFKVMGNKTYRLYSDGTWQLHDS